MNLVLLGAIPGIAMFWTLKLRAPKDDSNVEAVPGLYVKSTTLDLGNLSPDDIVNASFELVNHGSVPITLEHVQSTCGCTTVGGADGVIFPTRSHLISVRFDASHALPTRFDKQVLCKFSSPVATDVHFHIVGIISRSFWLTAIPDTLDFREPASGSVSKHTLYLFGGENILKAIPETIVLSEPDAAFSLDNTRLPGPISSKRILVVLSPTLTRNPGNLLGSIEFCSTTEVRRRVLLHVVANVVPKHNSQ
jgi:hypothetical protein